MSNVGGNNNVDSHNNNININYKEESLALFFDKPFEYPIYYRHCVPPKFFKNQNIASPVLRLRNFLIVLTFIEIFASIWGFSYYFIRRSMVYIFVNSLALLLSILGVYCTIYISELGLIFYSLVIIIFS